MNKYEPSGEEGTRSPPATPHHLQNLTACLIQNVRRGLEISQTLCYRIPCTFAKQVFLFNPSFYESLKNSKWLPGGLKMADGVWK